MNFPVKLNFFELRDFAGRANGELVASSYCLFSPWRANIPPGENAQFQHPLFRVLASFSPISVLNWTLV
ncbi:hypothetical protein MTR_8g447370 [Medicago truncatula]|uniref:Uncharacterized protein n=1 Tax=Medicago truncatula TaxID=3880 RepID=A0A072U0N5_MEDTR|nr:hypothetical protein MTR_8g447370 [Medicago truncatula]